MVSSVADRLIFITENERNAFERLARRLPGSGPVLRMVPRVRRTMASCLLNAATPEKIKAVAENLVHCVSGGAAMPVELLMNFEKAFGVEILEGYGLSETSPVATFNISVERRKPGSIGLPIWGVDVKLLDDEGKPVPQGERGEIVIRGHNIMKGYWQ